MSHSNESMPRSRGRLVSGVKRHFLVYPNYQTILEYNCVNAYGLSVALLGDESGGAAKTSTAKSSKGSGSKKKKKTTK